MSMKAAPRITRLGLTVGDVERAQAFYQHALGFELVEREARRGPAFEALTGLAGAKAEVAVLRLGAQEIELAAFMPAGRGYSGQRAANDPWFQHFAIAVADMERAYAEAVAHGGTPISRDGPQLLPPSTGSVTAWKFRDPEGHPLELSLIPHSAWTEAPARPGPCLGIDHTALAVADLAASERFYVDLLGFEAAGLGLNRGPEQDALDGLDSVELDIAVLRGASEGPHLELLHYRHPVSREAPRQPTVNAIASSRTIIACEDLQRLADRLRAAGVAFVSRAATPSRFLVRDPDGHLVELYAA